MKDKRNNFTSTTEHRRGSKYILAVIAAILFLLIVWCVCLVAGAFSQIKQIVVEGDSPYLESRIIAVSGIQEGSRSRSVDFDEARSDILNNLTYISEVKIKNKIGGKVIIKVTSDQASYITNISNDYFVISDDFRVLGSAGDVTLEAEPQFINLPTVKKAMIGSGIEFYGDSSYISEFIDIINNSSIAAFVTSIDVSDKYNIRVMYNDQHVVRFGEIKDMDTKLRKLNMILNSDVMNGMEKSIIDISNASDPKINPQ